MAAGYDFLALPYLSSRRCWMAGLIQAVSAALRRFQNLHWTIVDGVVPGERFGHHASTFFMMTVSNCKNPSRNAPTANATASQNRNLGLRSK